MPAVMDTRVSSRDISFMQMALDHAKFARERGEVPVGAVVVYDNHPVGQAGNRREQLQSPVAHAEMLALDEAATTLGRWRLFDCDLYVTLEPCIMCVGAILQARISRIVFGCLDAKAGAVISLYRLCEDDRLNHQLPVVGGVLAEESAGLLSRFFSDLREDKRRIRNAERWPSPVEGA
jgi:tRNA(adenine34) deaminase